MYQAAPNLSFWEKESFLNRSDYVIIGSGIVGLSAALHLKQREKGKKVTVLERGILPSGASTKNAGFACIGSRQNYFRTYQVLLKSKFLKRLKKDG